MAYNRYTSPRYQPNYNGLNRKMAEQLARNPRERVNLGALRQPEKSVPSEEPYIPNTRPGRFAQPTDYSGIRSPVVGGIVAAADIFSAKLERDRREEEAADAARRGDLAAANKLDAINIMKDKELTTQNLGEPAQPAFDPRTRPQEVLDPETGEPTRQNRGLAERLAPILNTPARQAFSPLDVDQRFAMARQVMGPTAALENRDELYAAGTPPQPTYENLTAGDSIYRRDPITGELKLVTTAPPKSDVLSEEALAQRVAIRAAGTQQPLTDTQAWTELSRPRDFKRSDEIITAGNNAAAQTQNLVEPLMLALNDPELYTGPGAEIALGLKKVAGAMGFEVKGVASGELAKTITAKMALDMKTDLPGPMSDSDRQFLVSLPPGLANTQEGNALIAQYYKRKNDLLIKYAKMTRDYEDKNGFVDQNHYAAMADWSAANPIFTQDDYDAVANVMSPTANNPAAGLPAAGLPGSGDDNLTKRGLADAIIQGGGN